TAVHALDGAVAGEGQLLLVAGEAGIGKSAVLAELARAAADRGGRVLRGVCWAGPGALAYWPWSQLLTELAPADLGAAQRLVAPEPASGATISGGAEAADERFRLFDAVTTAIRRASAAAPQLVIIDDLHWADDGSLRLLEF